MVFRTDVIDCDRQGAITRQKFSPDTLDCMHLPAIEVKKSMRLGLQFGSLSQLGDPDREKSKRVMQAMLKMKKIDIARLRQAYDQR